MATRVYRTRRTQHPSLCRSPRICPQIGRVASDQCLQLDLRSAEITRVKVLLLLLIKALRPEDAWRSGDTGQSILVLALTAVSCKPHAQAALSPLPAVLVLEGHRASL